MPPGTCTSDRSYEIAYPDPGDGLFSQIKFKIDSSLNNIDQMMFENITRSGNVRYAVQAAATLFIAMYGLAFTFGMIELTVFDLIIRLAKIGIITTIFTLAQAPNGWDDPGGHHEGSIGYMNFSKSIGTFFTYGTDEIINKVTSVAVGGFTDTISPVSFGMKDKNYIYGGGPFGPMDYALAMVVSPKMAATLIGAFTTGPYGIGVGLVLLLSLVSFLKSMLNAMWVYVMALVLRTFLFALAPLFIPCILFNRTRNLFDGWLNQVVNTCLQPIFLFSFFSFFAILFEACLDQVFQTPVCWTPMPEQVKGAMGDVNMWQWAVQDCKSGNWVPFTGKWDFYGPQGLNCGQSYSVNPLGIMLPLTLWIISDLASRFNDVVVQIAKDISSASTELRMGAEKIGSWMAGGGQGADGKMDPSQAGGGAAGIRKGVGGESGGIDFGKGLSQLGNMARDVGLVGNRNSPK